MSNFPSVRPSLNLQFDSQPTPADMTSHLASVGATFSRASIGTYTDANGLVAEATAGQARPNYSTAGVHEGLLIEEARTNLVKSSEDFSLWVTSGSPVVTRLAELDPMGKATAFKIEDNNTSGNFDGIFLQTYMASGSATYTLSFYYKNNLGYSGQVKMQNYDNSESETINLGSATEWTKVVTTKAFTDTKGRITINIWPAGYGPNRTGSVELCMFQLEEGSFPTSYIPTIPTFTSRASDGTYFDSSGVLQTASTDEERIDHKYINGEWVEAGLLLEAQSTNLFTDSRPHNWSKNAGCTSSTTTSPISTNTYSVLTHDGTNSDPYFVRGCASGASLANRTFTFSAYMYSISGSANMQMFMYDNSVGNVFSKSITLTTTPQLYSLTATFPSGETDTNFNCRFDLSNTAQSIGVFEAQAEEGSVATSRIPTTSAQVTRSADVYTTATKERSADVCYIDGTAFTDFYNQEEGTFFVFWEGFTDGGVDRWIGVHDSSKANVFDDRIIFAFSTSAESIRITISDDGVVQTSSVNDTDVAQTTPNKYALAVKLNDVNSYQDGVQVVSDTSVTMPSADKLVFHNGAGVRPFQGYIRKLIYFPRRLSDNELIKLTQ